MKRKLIQMAGKTMVVSLPSPWIKKYGLKKGEEIDLEEKGKNILIKIDSKKENMGKEILIDIPTEDLFFERSLHVWYRRGYNQITVIFEDKDVLRKIRKSVKKLLGFEI
ncbi:MAG: AbrB/MazE/SpoVT family DNA-binding domain-containing protein, partial [Nanoarchaeota archaeon]|nr:AbrB/MazE/SpoVT family DNA-binding domain-containing protein [Nanoarchaeota archaeon]